jgi:hypothetical protein
MLFGKEPILSAIMSSAMVLFMSSAMAHMSLRRNCGEVDAMRGAQKLSPKIFVKNSK